jgi:hypothetical protein
MIAYVSVTDELGIWSRIKKTKKKGMENEISVQIPKGMHIHMLFGVVSQHKIRSIHVNS